MFCIGTVFSVLEYSLMHSINILHWNSFQWLLKHSKVKFVAVHVYIQIAHSSATNYKHVIDQTAYHW